MNHLEREHQLFLHHLQGMAGDEDLAGFFDFLKPKSRTYATKPVLSKGATGAVVEELQTLLGMQPDGDFGFNTEMEVRSYQTSQGIPATGVVNDQTWAALLGEQFKAQQTAEQKAETAAAITAGAGAITDLISQFVIPPANQEELLSAPVEVPEPSGPSWGTIAIVGGAVVVLGAGGFFLYRSISRRD